MIWEEQEFHPMAVICDFVILEYFQNTSSEFPKSILIFHPFAAPTEISLYLWAFHLFHQILGKKVLNELSQVFPDDGLMEEGHSAVHQSDDGGSAVSSQLVGQTRLITQVHNADAHT